VSSWLFFLLSRRITLKKLIMLFFCFFLLVFIHWRLVSKLNLCLDFSTTIKLILVFSGFGLWFGSLVLSRILAAVDFSLASRLHNLLLLLRFTVFTFDQFLLNSNYVVVFAVKLNAFRVQLLLLFGKCGHRVGLCFANHFVHLILELVHWWRSGDWRIGCVFRCQDWVGLRHLVHRHGHWCIWHRRLLMTRCWRPWSLFLFHYRRVKASVVGVVSVLFFQVEYFRVNWLGHRWKGSRVGHVELDSFL